MKGRRLECCDLLLHRVHVLQWTKRNNHQRILAVRTEGPDVAFNHRNQFPNVFRLALKILTKNGEHSRRKVYAMNGNSLASYRQENPAGATGQFQDRPADAL